MDFHPIKGGVLTSQWIRLSKCNSDMTACKTRQNLKGVFECLDASSIEISLRWREIHFHSPCEAIS